MVIVTYRTPFYIKNDAGEYVEVGSIEIPLKVTVKAVGPYANATIETLPRCRCPKQCGH